MIKNVKYQIETVSSISKLEKKRNKDKRINIYGFTSGITRLQYLTKKLV